MSTFIGEVYSQIEQYELHDLRERLNNILESSVYGSAPMEDTQDAIEEVWQEIEDYIESMKIPPEEEELLLHHPNMCV